MKSKGCSRHGLSVVEFLGCFSAMVGGVVLGSMYLGVDVRQMTVAVLKQTKLIDADEKDVAVAATPTVEAGESPAAPTDTAVVSAPVAPTPSDVAQEQPAAESPQENPPTEPAATPAEAPAVEPAPAAAPAGPLAGLLSRENLIDLTDEQRRTLTLAYWEALDNTTKEEVKHRHEGLPEDGNWQLFDYLTCRKQGHEQATTFISQLHLRGVDPHVASYAEKALAWHRDGVKLFSRALDLLTDAPGAQLSGPFAQSWQSAATQHQMEERLLREKHHAVQAYLNHSLSAPPAADEATAPAAEATPATN